jgi:hypothetical protein
LRQRIRAFHTNFSKLTLSPVSAYSDSPEVPHRLSVSYRKHHTESLCIVSTKSSPIRRSADSVQCFTTYGFRDTEGKWPSIQKFVDMRFLLCSMAHLVLNDRIELFVLIRIMMVIERLIGNFRISTVMKIFHSLLTEMYYSIEV